MDMAPFQTPHQAYMISKNIGKYLLLHLILKIYFEN
jgi:hypothetical protein